MSCILKRDDLVENPYEHEVKDKDERHRTKERNTTYINRSNRYRGEIFPDVLTIDGHAAVFISLGFEDLAKERERAIERAEQKVYLYIYVALMGGVE